MDNSLQVVEVNDDLKEEDNLGIEIHNKSRSSVNVDELYLTKFNPTALSDGVKIETAKHHEDPQSLCSDVSHQPSGRGIHRCEEALLLLRQLGLLRGPFLIGTGKCLATNVCI